MKILEHYSLKVARDVVNKINLPAKIAEYVEMTCWANSREQGLSIAVSFGNIENWKRVNVAQYRSSDDIVVIFGGYCDFDLQTNQPNEDAYKSRKFFKYNEQKKAADYIKSLIVEAYKFEVELMKIELDKRFQVKA